ncbi:TIGR01621 family pseudouridine synthase [Agaribacter marinus]|uniref:RNA pseudouridine synthase n=1 Tax=Agaribacter marinus TaxID=1431249 RepID=A0AA37T1D9_9ALTE|nr:TIGR01621 family pseudouridine synthase [Agaribacter marinus]GLR70613.1 RNA pseudouridine synthase [Agaribacter marinus]
MLAPEILFENVDFMVIYKPCQVEMHSAENGIIPKTKAISGNTSTLFLVHRLDKGTSGLLILAKNKPAAAVLSQNFAERKVNKYYIALTSGKPKKKQGLIKGDMQKSRNGSYKLVKTHQNPAITQFFTNSFAPNIRLYILKPYTGKTHQLRVALQSNSTPILGDTRYSPQNTGANEDRMYLHACYLSFEFDGIEYTFICPPKEGERWQDQFDEDDISAFTSKPLPKINWHKEHIEQNRD